MPSAQELQTAISNMSIWRKGDQRAPHKPLLLLYVLSAYQQGHPRLFHYGDEIRPQLLALLNSFGPQRRAHYPEMPFWRLKGDGFWQLQNDEYCSPQKGSKEPPNRELIKHSVMGGFDEVSYQLLCKQPQLIDKLSQQILSEHFPESVQEVIANRLELSLDDVRKSRDPHFRQTVLRAYQYRCAVCGYDLRHDTTPVGLEAAHIKWKQYGGPCTVTNGLALCSVHHSAFDIGVIGIDDSMKLMVSEGVNGSKIVERLFWDFEGKSLFLPKKREYYPLDRFVEWHRGQVFKGA
ncbi:HNH endonuclease [Pectobacterium carotovorum]|uniref:phosphorothioated DNA-binding restriction endonuclease n=1 Tax=Pectobacterium TaxID=122277 RepID=UPI001CFAB697|nr:MULTISPECIES: HNH endonuclease [Pectobacterium]UCZ78384.1 HNH endonuclease [Pectobacterium carotovorum]